MGAAQNLPAISGGENHLDFGAGTSFQLDMSDMGQVDSLRFTVMSYVVEEKYDRAVEALHRYVEKRSDYPQYRRRTEPLVRHCTDLIFAIRSKRSLPGIGNLSASKQQEIFDRAREHFEELKLTLKRMEKVEADLRRADMRSTIWVLNALTLSIFTLVIVGFFNELTNGLLQSMMIVFAGWVDSILSFFKL